MQTKFRVRFPIPYSNYLELLHWIQDDTQTSGFHRFIDASAQQTARTSPPRGASIG